MTDIIKVPTPTGEVDAEVVNIESCTDAAVECKLSDGETLLIRPVVMAVAKSVNATGPNYFVKIQNIIEKK